MTKGLVVDEKTARKLKLGRKATVVGTLTNSALASRQARAEAHRKATMRLKKRARSSGACAWPRPTLRVTPAADSQDADRQEGAPVEALPRPSSRVQKEG